MCCGAFFFHNDPFLSFFLLLWLRRSPDTNSLHQLDWLSQRSWSWRCFLFCFAASRLLRNSSETQLERTSTQVCASSHHHLQRDQGTCRRVFLAPFRHGVAPERGRDLRSAPHRHLYFSDMSVGPFHISLNAGFSVGVWCSCSFQPKVAKEEDNRAGQD